MMQALDAELLLPFLEEDLSRGDITSEALIPVGAVAEGWVVARQAGVLAGLEVALTLLDLAGAEGTALAQDGDEIAIDQQVLGVRGPARALLAVERTMLNFLAHLSGIATVTRVAVRSVEGTGARIAATRKTLPGLRRFEKRAVVLGGGDPHRFDLGAAVLIKDNHLALSGDVAEAVQRARSAVSFTSMIEVEVESAEQALQAAAAGADVLLLDNLSPEGVTEVIARLRREGLRESVRIEVSGGITPERARAYAEAGAEIISMGALTLSAPALDFSLEMGPAA